MPHADTQFAPPEFVPIRVLSCLGLQNSDRKFWGNKQYEINPQTQKLQEEGEGKRAGNCARRVNSLEREEINI